MIECSDSAYSRIKGSKIERKIIKNKENTYFFEDFPYTIKGKRIINGAKNYPFLEKKISERDYVYKNIIELGNIIDNDLYFRNDFEKVSIEHPFFLSYYILGKELFDYEKFKFNSVKSLGDALVSYAFKESKYSDSIHNYDSLIWRNNGKKNECYRNVLGDMYVSQTDVSSPEKEVITLFGSRKEFDSIIYNPSSGSICGYQDWSGYLIAALKYAERLGKLKIPEIIDWHDYYKKTHSGGAYTEAGDEASFGLRHYMESPIISKEEKLEMFPLSIFGASKNKKYPYFEGDKLFYIEENKEGDLDLSDKAPLYFKDNKFSKVIEYTESDLPNMLKGSYKLFSRVIANMFYIMKEFNKNN